MSLTQRLLLVVLIIAHLALETGLIAVLRMPRMDLGLVVEMLVGAAGAIPFGQVILLGFWLSRYSSGFFTRLVGVSFTGAVYWLSLVAAIREFGNETYILGVMIAAGIALAWAFFEAIRRWWPWLVEHLHGGFYLEERRQISLMQIMVWMSLFGIVLALHRAILSGSVERALPPFFSWHNMLMSIAMLGMVLFINLLVVFPCIALAMKALESRSAENDLALGLLFPIVYAFGVAIAEVAIMSLFARSLPEHGMLIVALFGMNAAQFVTVAGTIVLLRHIGFIRVRG